MIITDTNVLLAFLLTDGITRKIITENPGIYISPEHCYDELWEHRRQKIFGDRIKVLSTKDIIRLISFD